MPRIAYEDKRFRADSLSIITRADQICRQYAADGYSLTLRQLYYRFVANAWLANTDQNYKRLGSIINDARIAGLIDWSHLEDRTRRHVGVFGWDSPDQIVTSAAEGYRREPWAASEQEYRPEVWVEKEALADVVSRACDTYRVPYFACRGYVSQSAMWRAAQRMRNTYAQGFTPIVIHLGDHDPSGIDMTRDIEDRLRLFTGRWVDVRRIALNMNQVEEYAPPPNPAKLTDARAPGYIEQYGYESWELDALPPNVLDNLINQTVREHIDLASFEQVDVEDEVERDRLREVAELWPQISGRLDEVRELLES